MSKKCEHLNEDGTFKGGFDGCVTHMMDSCGGGHSEESAKKICGSIAAMKSSDQPGAPRAEIQKPKSDIHNPDDRVALRSISAVGETDGDIGRMMYVPGGVHDISCGCADKAFAEVTVAVGPETAAVLNASLARVNAKFSPQRALIDFAHQSKEAMAWPIAFEWSNQPKPGVYVRAELSSIGKDYISGKVVRSFSGCFFTDADIPKRSEIRAGKTYRPAEGKRGSPSNPARIVSLDFPYAGTLTNNPAFQENLPLWAEHASAADRSKPEQVQQQSGQEGRAPCSANAGPDVSNQQPKINTMKLTEQQKATLRAKIAQLEQDIPVLRATKEQNPENEAEIAARESELESSKSQLQASELAEKNEVLETALTAQRTKDADAAVLSAVKRGAIAIKNLELQTTWKQKCIEDPSNIALLNAMNGSAAAAAVHRIVVSPRVEVTRASSGSVLMAVHKERNPIARATLYANEIRKRLAEGDPMSFNAPELAPLRADNAVGTLVGTLVSQRTLELLKLTFPILSSISTDFSDQNGRMNQTIDTRVISIPTAQDYVPATGWPQSDVIATDVPVTLNKQKGVEVRFTADVLAGTVRRLFDEFGPAQAYALAKSMVDELYKLFTSANYADNAVTVAPLIDFGRPTLIDVGVLLDGQGVPDGPMNRFCLLNAPYFGGLKKDQAIVTLAAFQSKEIIEQGVLPDVEGFRVIKAVNLTANAGATVVGFAGSKSSAVIAARVDSDYATILPGSSYGNVSVVTDPDIGLSVLQVQYVNHQLASANQRISFIFGVAKAQTKAGDVIKSQ